MRVNDDLASRLVPDVLLGRGGVKVRTPATAAAAGPHGWVGHYAAAFYSGTSSVDWSLSRNIAGYVLRASKVLERDPLKHPCIYNI